MNRRNFCSSCHSFGYSIHTFRYNVSVCTYVHIVFFFFFFFLIRLASLPHRGNWIRRQTMMFMTTTTTTKALGFKRSRIGWGSSVHSNAFAIHYYTDDPTWVCGIHRQFEAVVVAIVFVASPSPIETWINLHGNENCAVDSPQFKIFYL